MDDDSDPECGKCKDGFYSNLPTFGCKDCNCNNLGTENEDETCDVETGACRYDKACNT